ncbi:MAG: hypothetical protein JXP34_26560 [Planctomycetes bacterium]|nr:hypothetical protein [Planctomycetota bacterium]
MTKPQTSGPETGLRFKDGPYLTRKVERIMLQIARGKTAGWIAQLYGVRESLVRYIAGKTGFPAGTLGAAAAASHDAAEEGMPDAPVRPFDEEEEIVVVDDGDD